MLGLGASQEIAPSDPRASWPIWAARESRHNRHPVCGTGPDARQPVSDPGGRSGHDLRGVQTIGVARASTPPGVGDVNAMSSTARSRSAARAGNAPRPPKHGDVLRPPDVTADSTSHLGSAARPNPTSHHHVPDEIRPDEEHPRALGAVGNSVTLTEPHHSLAHRRSAARGDPPFKGHLLECILQRTTVPSLSTFACPLRISCRPCLFRGLPVGTLTAHQNSSHQESGQDCEGVSPG